jgi:hypothetical protein
MQSNKRIEHFRPAQSCTVGLKMLKRMAVLGCRSQSVDDALTPGSCAGRADSLRMS